MRLHHFHGGLELPRHKAQATATAIRACPLPTQLRVSLLQHAGGAASPCVQAGDTVRAGQCLGEVREGRGANVHAPASGTVLAIENAPLASPQGLSAAHVLLAVDTAQAPPLRLPALDWQCVEPHALIDRVREGGIVGLGGAGFPTADKLAVDRKLLVINGAECEPWIACDDRLLRERAESVVLGARVLRRAVSAQRVVLAVESAMTEAIAACAAALERAGADEVTLVAVPTIYPEGGERQLIRVLTGMEVPRGGLPRDIGVLVQNVGTAHAAWQAVAHGQPLTHRIVTVTGPGVAEPGNWEVAIGTPISHLIAQAGGYTPAAARLLLGGPLMGAALAHDEFPIGKTSNCVLVLSAAELRDPQSEMPCIRCGDCAAVCPARLQPQLLLAQVRGEQWARAMEHGLADCIECGCCDLVCPSHIPLVQHYRYGKTSVRVRERDKRQADAARERFEARTQRLARVQELRQRQRVAHSETAASADAVAAAIARAKARRDNNGSDPA